MLLILCYDYLAPGAQIHLKINPAYVNLKNSAINHEHCYHGN